MSILFDYFDMRRIFALQAVNDFNTLIESSTTTKSLHCCVGFFLFTISNFSIH